MAKRPTLRHRLRAIKLLLLDVDGVMTDGGVYLSETGDELKKFNIQDGYGIVKLQRNGIRVGLLTGRASKLIMRRAAELGISEVHQNLENKIGAYESLKARFGLADGEVAFMGDDEPDLEVLRKVGFSAAPADAAPSVRKAVDFVCAKRGGEGAVREVIDLLLEGRKNGRGISS